MCCGLFRFSCLTKYSNQNIPRQVIRVMVEHNRTLNLMEQTFEITIGIVWVGRATDDEV